MATVGNLFIGVNAKTSAFEAALARARKSINDFAASFTVRNLVTYGSAIAGIATAVGGYYLHTQAEAIDQASKLARSLGLATDSLLGMQHGANLAGVSQDALGGALNKLARKLGEAASGSKEAQDAFTAIGLSVDSLAGLGLDQVMGQVADGIAGLEGPAARTAAAVDIFGRSGADLMPWLLDGSKGMRDMAEEAKALGLAVGDAGGRSIEEMNDSITRMQTALSGVATVILTEAAPYVVALADYILDAAKSTGGFRDAAKSAFEYVIPAASVAAGMIDTIGLAIAAARASTLGWGAAYTFIFANILDGINWISLGMGQLVAGIRDKANALREVSSGMGQQTIEAVAEMGKAWDRMGSDPMARFSDRVDRTRQRMEALAASTEQAAPAIKSVAAAVDLAKGKLDDGVKAADALARRLFEQATTWGMAGREAEIYLAAMGGATAEQLAYLGRVDAFLTRKEDEAKALERTAKAAEEAKDAYMSLLSEGERVFRDVMTPAERYASEIEHLQELLVAGAIGQETYDRAVKKAAEEMDRSATTAASAVQAMADATIGIQSAFGEMKIANVVEAMTVVPATAAAVANATPAGVARVADSSEAELRRSNAYLERIANSTEAFAGALS